MLDLKPFQYRAVQDLFKGFYSSEKEIILKSCTGSGKTIMLSTFIDEFLKRESNYVFIWLTPGKGDLEEQSKSKMDKYYPNNKTFYLNHVLLSGFHENDICYINWELVVKKGNKSLKDGDKSDLIDRIKVAKEQGLKFIIIIDESHSNDTVKSEILLNYFEAEKIIKASATPKEYYHPYIIDVPENVVIEEGLIKKRILINEDIYNESIVNNQTRFLIDLAIKKRNKIKEEFVNIDLNINPLVLIQIPNNQEFMLIEVEDYLLENEITYGNGKLAVWLSNKKINIENVVENDDIVDYLIIKQAITTGWDCPRAHVLVKLRANSSETFDIQTIGRIRRMPEANHYNVDILDSAYLYTVDMKFVEDVKNSFGKNALKAKKIYLKEEYAEMKLVKELRSFQPIGSDPDLALRSIHNFLVKKYNLDKLNINKMKLEITNYLFNELIVRNIHRGNVMLLDLKTINELDEIDIFEPLNTHTHGREFHSVLAKIGSDVGLPYDVIRLIIRRLFEKDVKPTKYKLLLLSTRKIYSFVINNQARIKEDILDAMSDISQQSLNLKVNLKTKEVFKFPCEMIFTYDEDSRVQKIYTKNVYEGYLSSAEIRSIPEKEFEKYLQNSNSVNWFYKNGDKGLEFLSIVYRDNSGKQKLFYPDYIVNIDGNAWVIETKGGFSRSGTSEDIDKYSHIKFDALKEYGKNYQIRIGFVRKDKNSTELLMATDKFSESLESDCWGLIEDVL